MFNQVRGNSSSNGNIAHKQPWLCNPPACHLESRTVLAAKGHASWRVAISLMQTFLPRLPVLLQVDYNNDGRLEALEIEIAILKLYNVINKRLPGWQNPPTRPKIREALKLFDEDGNGTLDKHVRTHSHKSQEHAHVSGCHTPR